MNFDHFKSKIDSLKSLELGGLDAQFKLAPKLRKKYNLAKIKAQAPKRAAVLALFYTKEDNNTYVLLTQRASYKGAHSAQISFPGGKIEEQDKNLANTALRETFEEVGIPAYKIIMLRELTDVFIPPSNFLATPFMGVTNHQLDFTTNHEVANIIEVPVSKILDPDSLVSVPMVTSYMGKENVPAFKINNHIIWGATGMMLAEIKDLLHKTISK